MRPAAIAWALASGDGARLIAFRRRPSERASGQKWKVGKSGLPIALAARLSSARAAKRHDQSNCQPNRAEPNRAGERAQICPQRICSLAAASRPAGQRATWQPKQSEPADIKRLAVCCGHDDDSRLDAPQVARPPTMQSNELGKLSLIGFCAASG